MVRQFNDYSAIYFTKGLGTNSKGMELYVSFLPCTFTSLDASSGEESFPVTAISHSLMTEHQIWYTCAWVQFDNLKFLCNSLSFAVAQSLARSLRMPTSVSVVPRFESPYCRYILNQVMQSWTSFEVQLYSGFCTEGLSLYIEILSRIQYSFPSSSQGLSLKWRILSIIN